MITYTITSRMGLLVGNSVLTCDSSVTL
uniref:Uncharacterized protein n=1 Tax=Heterorhabditis bacteriophora TaxID=37862 RepID=A0A1I7W6L5_HETBA